MLRYSHGSRSLHRPVGLIGALTGIALLGALAVSGCSEREKITNSEPGDDPVDWRLGDEVVYEETLEAGESLYDDVTQCTFSFPEGKSGSLNVAPILDGPDAPLSGVGYQIEYEGTEPAILSVGLDGAEHVVLLGYGQVEGCFDDQLAGTARWVGVPPESEQAEALNFLVHPGEGAAVRLAVAPPAPFSKYWICKITPNSTDAERRINLELQAQTYIDGFLSALSPTMRTAAETEMGSRLRLRYEWDGDYYTGFWWRSLGSAGRIVRPTVHLKLTSNAGTVAHEIGHYLTHVIVGDDAQSSLEGQAPLLSGHGIRDEMGRTYMVEDYAYLVQYFLTGGVGSLDLLDPYTIFQGFTPLTRDYPGLEGFPSVMLATLVRSEPQMRDLTSGQMVPVPVVDLPWSDVFALYSKRHLGIDALRNEIETALGPDAKKFGVMLQRSGWSYSVTGRLVDGSGNPQSGYVPRSIKRIDGTVYEGGWTSIPTGADGRFSLVGDVFGGPSELRVVAGSDTAYVAIEIPWTGATSQRVDLGDLLVERVPVVTGVTPPYAKAGDPVTVQGQNFGGVQGDGVLEIGGIEAQITQWVDFAISAIVPNGVQVGESEVVVTRGGTSSVPYPIGIDDEWMAALRRTARVDFSFYAPHQYEPWWIGEDSSLNHLLQVMEWTGFGFTGGMEETVDGGVRTLTFSGSVSPDTRTASVDFVYTDTRPNALVKSKHAKVENLPFDAIIGADVQFSVDGTAGRPYVIEASWEGRGSDGGGLIDGTYVGTDWTYPESYYILALRFRM
ncbi:MAG: IPT/TIG domain-containing protein [Candidatus Eisenbacteria bacterium]|uniref:IPT/TIG domain-containing protein n=1 Tax=Eiseniibacteriota bacterium TaxID=2212470 RepID=A0A956NAR9_UNCEI|nr:IPT/TIG domain-containing protein [Candidatus Eisenbacteria bacterium]